MQALQTIFKNHDGKILYFRMSTDDEGHQIMDNILLSCVYPQTKKNTLQHEIREKFGMNIVFNPRGKIMLHNYNIIC